MRRKKYFFVILHRHPRTPYNRRRLRHVCTGIDTKFRERECRNVLCCSNQSVVLSLFLYHTHTRARTHAPGDTVRQYQRKDLFVFAIRKLFECLVYFNRIRTTTLVVGSRSYISCSQCLLHPLLSNQPLASSYSTIPPLQSSTFPSARHCKNVCI